MTCSLNHAEEWDLGMVRLLALDYGLFEVDGECKVCGAALVRPATDDDLYYFSQRLDEYLAVGADG